MISRLVSSSAKLPSKVDYHTFESRLLSKVIICPVTLITCLLVRKQTRLVQSTQDAPNIGCLSYFRKYHSLSSQSQLASWLSNQTTYAGQLQLARDSQLQLQLARALKLELLYQLASQLASQSYVPSSQLASDELESTLQLLASQLVEPPYSLIVAPAVIHTVKDCKHLLSGS